jgi:RNA polymerase sigma factor (sigma-70 family)
MALSDSELVLAAQCGGPDSDQSREELPIRFRKLLFYLASHACRLNGLHASEAEEVVQYALQALFDSETARFDSGRSEDDRVEPYLRGLIQNAARKHARSIWRGSDQHHDYASPLNGKRGLPSSVDDIRDPRDGRDIVENRDLVSAVIDLAGADERELIERIFFSGHELGVVAADLGVDPSTVSRRLGRLYGRVRRRSYRLLRSHTPWLN